MHFIFIVFCHVIFFINFPSEINGQDEIAKLKEQYTVKNTIEDFETEWALHFKPNSKKINKKDSPSLQNAEIRRQKWEYIFEKLADSHIIRRLDSELQKAGILRAVFCKEIAEVYFSLSYNASLFDKETDSIKPLPNPLKLKSMEVFLNVISDLKLNPDNAEESVKIPKSLYVDLLRKDALGILHKNHLEERISRLKHVYRDRVQKARDQDNVEAEEIDSVVNSEEY
ncbi:uncharacterized protein LOC135834793 [Planococcus citri]|uniref:uncharacterized protein LOC135834793 n=1 Tax=Planococcus citri TaxID=170843 RepID=UPI0031F9932C